MRKFIFLITTAFLSACGGGTQQDNSNRVSTMSTSSLWITQATTSSATQLAFVEAELASRGQRSSGSWYLGKRSSAALGKRRYGRSTIATNSRNCSDFPSSLSAQRFFLRAGGPATDPHDLDRDGDGFACEWGTTLRQVARASKPKRVSRRTYGSRCYVGPRGGTYTITASGNKNYSGC